MSQCAAALVVIGTVLAAVPSVGAPPSGDARSQIEAARARLREHDLATARDLLESAARLDPSLPEVDLLLGQVYSAQGRYPEAIDRLERAVRRDPRSAQSRYLLGITFSLSGDVARAVPELEE